MADEELLAQPHRKVRMRRKTMADFIPKGIHRYRSYRADLGNETTVCDLARGHFDIHDGKREHRASLRWPVHRRHWDRANYRCRSHLSGGNFSSGNTRSLHMCISGSVYVGIMLSYFASWGSSIHISNNSAKQWIVPTTLHIIFAGIIFILSFTVYESPRYMLKVNKKDQALETMSTLRNLPPDHPYVQTEMMDIQDQLERERESTLGSHFFGPLRELFTLPSNRYRIMIGLMSQLLSQWSGANSITIYAPKFFAMLGTTGQSEKLFATAIFGVVKLVSSLVCALFLVDFLGRKRALGYGITLQFVSILYVAIYLSVVPSIPNGFKPEGHTKRAGTAAIVSIYVSGVGWALGWNSIQYLINAEIFPLRVRALGTSMVMCFHFANQYGNSKAVPLTLLDTAMRPYGTFYFFATVTLIGLAWMWFFLPETAGKSLEAMDEMFSLPWHIIGRKGARMTGRSGYAKRYRARDAEKGGVSNRHIGSAPPSETERNKK
ncbi:hypothetical protein ACJ72_00720 [Emergomyces africanus]|uniref:Major facilitator superfamily (MFS) profile domain-containing protein n=1 Tax=Emergomyces africanus TaxID=1955775 RepID=A0A1B7P7D4_9EURO|nr:hypothetical protein ACJ72_00720 [Emergomyces africanus]